MVALAGGSGDRLEGGAPLSAQSRTGLVPNFLLLLGAQVMSKATTLIALVLLSRYLGSEFYGRFAVAAAIPLALEAFVDAGLSQAIVREGAGRPAVIRHDVSSVVPAKLGFGAMGIGITYVIATVLGLGAELVEVAVYLALVKAMDSLTILLRGVFEAHEHMEYEAASIVVDSLVRLLFVAYALYSGFGLIGLAKAYVVSSAILLAATSIIAVHRFLPMWPPLPDRTRLLTLLGVGAPFAAVWLLDGLAVRACTVLIGVLAGDAPAGEFAAASRLIEPLFIVPYMMAAAALPLAARHLFERRATLPSLLVSSLKLALTFAFADAIVLIGGATFLVGAVFGPDFSGAAGILSILAIALLPAFTRATLTNFLIVLDAQRLLIGAQIVSITIAIGLAVALVPAGGPRAGAAAIAIGEFVGIVAMGVGIQGVLPLRLKDLARTVAAGTIALVVLGITPLVSPMVATLLALAALFAGIRRLRAFDEDEVGYLQRAVPVLGPLMRALLGPVPAR